MLEAPKRYRDERISEVLLQKMRTLMECMMPQAMVPAARAHGDFTPPNIRVRGKELLLKGWQLSSADMPALYDLFHFFYQNGTACRRPFAAIRKEIDETLRRPEWEAFLLEHEIEPNEAEQQYLLSAVSRCLHQYAGAKWSREMPRMMQVWCEAFGFWNGL